MRPSPDQINRQLQKGLAHHQNQDYEAAFACFEDLLAKAPGLADGWYLSGLAAQQLARHSEAARRIRRAILLSPNNPFYHLNLGNALQSGGDYADAEAQFRRALAIDSNFASAHHNLANLLVLNKRNDEALGEYDRALMCDPRHQGAMIALSRLLVLKRAFPSALALAKRAIALRPDDHGTLLQCLPILIDAKQSASALDFCALLLARQPDSKDVLAYQGRALYELQRYRDAIATLQQVIRLDPDDLSAIDLLISILVCIGDPERGSGVILDYLQSHPNDLNGYSEYLFLLNYSARLSQVELLAAHREWDSRHGHAGRVADHSNLPDPHRRLRLGYVSPDFRQHAVSFFIEPVIEQHDRDGFDVYAYSNTKDPDPTTERLKSKVTVFRDIADLPASAVANLIAADGIDLLIDLAGHTGGNSLGTFALKPAPVQLTWLGYPNTTGLAAMDYRISDAVADPPGIGDTWNAETVLRMPECFHCYRPGSTTPINATPASREQGFITFASFNVLGKLSDLTLAAWSQILAAVPSARLLLKTHGLTDELASEQLTKRLIAHGIEPTRVRLVGFQAQLSDHLAIYRQVDIALDTFPYNGTTTTCDALWMGVPVVCLLGDRHAARVGASLLHAVGLKELQALVTHSVDDYVAAAVALANDADRLAALHRALRPALTTSPLMDAKRFTRDLESLYRGAWQNWCADQDRAGSLLPP